jgi:hypothetical protein
MSTAGSFCFEGNAYMDQSYLLNSSIGTSIFTAGIIKTSSIDMLNTAGNYQRITNADTPILPNDVVIKSYVDMLGININAVTLVGTQGTVITNSIGSFVITVSNQVSNGPCATFHVSKNATNICGHIVRISSVPGISFSKTCLLDMNWPVNSPLVLFKKDINFDGSYLVKLM